MKLTNYTNLNLCSLYITNIQAEHLADVLKEFSDMVKGNHEAVFESYEIRFDDALSKAPDDEVDLEVFPKAVNVKIIK